MFGVQSNQKTNDEILDYMLGHNSGSQTRIVNRKSIVFNNIQNKPLFRGKKLFDDTPDGMKKQLYPSFKK